MEKNGEFKENKVVKQSVLREKYLFILLPDNLISLVHDLRSCTLVDTSVRAVIRTGVKIVWLLGANHSTRIIINNYSVISE